VTGVRVLLVEDDSELAGMLAELFSSEGYAVEVASDGQRALHRGLTGDYDVMVVDRGLPAVEGLDLVRRLRRSGRFTPVLVLSALGEPRDRVDGLDAGAEDYLAKPFDVDELLARLRALTRRHAERAERLSIPGGSLDLGSREVTTVSGDVVPLSTREYDLLVRLAASPGRVFTRSELLLDVFEDAEADGVVDTYVHYLRRKLGRETINTVRGLGYRLGRA
jgi:two-component system response regulator QseB